MNCRELRNFICKISRSFWEHPVKDHNKISFQSCAFTCTGKFSLCQAYPKIPSYVTGLFYRLFSSQSWHKESHCYANMLNSKECSIRLLTVPHKWNPKLVFRYSLGQQSNLATTFSRALPQRYVADFEHVQTIIYT